MKLAVLADQSVRSPSIIPRSVSKARGKTEIQQRHLAASVLYGHSQPGQEMKSPSEEPLASPLMLGGTM